MPTATHNQVAYDFQSVETEFIADGSSFGIVEGLDKFDYKATINRTEFYGRSRLPLVVTEGDAKFEASIDIHRYWFNTVVAKSKELGIGLATMKMILAFSYFAPDTELITDTLVGVRVNEISNSGQHGSDHQMVSIPLRVGNIYWAGIDLFGNKL
jgi:hypothetical protein